LERNPALTRFPLVSMPSSLTYSNVVNAGFRSISQQDNDLQGVTPRSNR
jgi:hypothetical protein